MAEPAPEYTQRKALIYAVVAVLAIQHLMPFGRTLLYPFTLLATWVHEMGHGLTALIAGGRFDHLEIFGNASGLAHCFVSVGWKPGLVALGGLLAPPLAGTAILLGARGPRRARIVLAVIAGALVLSLAIWVRSLAGWLAMPIVAAALGFVAWKGTPKRRLIVTQFVGVLLALDTVSRIDYLFTSHVEVDGVHRSSDIQNVAEAFGGHYLVWGLLIAVLSLGTVGLALWSVWRKKK
jgi:hypothetical protein